MAMPTGLIEKRPNSVRSNSTRRRSPASVATMGQGRLPPGQGLWSASPRGRATARNPTSKTCRRRAARAEKADPAANALTDAKDGAEHRRQAGTAPRARRTEDCRGRVPRFSRASARSKPVSSRWRGDHNAMRPYGVDDEGAMWSDPAADQSRRRERFARTIPSGQTAGGRVEGCGHLRSWVREVDAQLIPGKYDLYISRRF